MEEGLLRQRRNLMITCSILWIMKSGEVEFSKISFAGFDVTFKDPNALTLSMWITFAYFLCRYYQYFLNEGISKLERIFRDSFNQKCESRIRQLVEERYPQNTEKHLYNYGFLKNNHWIYKGGIQHPYDPSLSESKFEQFEIAISRWKLWKGILSAIMDSIFRNSVVTDYLLPFILADFILYYCGKNDWNGSFLHLIMP
jgi:hypothetical protein